MPSKLEQMQLQFRQKLLQEKEERLIKIHTDNQQKALSQVAKHNGIPTTRTTTLTTVSKPPPAMMMMAAAAPHHPYQSHHSSPVKKGSPGVDRSRPLPPIAKEPKKGPPSHSRISPVSAPVDNGLKFASGNNIRSKSVELEPRQSPGKGYQNGRTQARNGFVRSAFEGETSAASEAQVQKKTEHDALVKLKQAELQRLRGNSKVEDMSPRNGYATYAVPKSSSHEKKLVSNNRTQATPRYEPPRTNKAAPKRPLAGGAAGCRTQVAAAAHGGRKPPGPGQEQCAVCGRNFNADRIEKHRTICSRAAKKKVKVFDATKMRVQGTEAEKYVRKGLPKTVPKPKNSNWRKQHEEFIEAIRQAKMVQQHVAAGGKVSDLPPPPPSDTSHYVPCPHCGRRFNEGVAERHIPKCKNIACNKKAPLPRRK